MVKRKLFTISLCFLLIFSLCFVTGAYGATLNDVNNQIEDKQQELQEGQAEKEKVLGEIEKLTDKINGMQDEIDSIQANINNTQSQIDVTKAKLKDLQEKMDEQSDNLNKRLRTMYMNDNTTFVEVILSSGSISELLVNVEMIKRIHKGDKELLAALEKQHKDVEAEKKKLDQLKASLEADQSSVKTKQGDLEVSKADLDDKAESIQKENESLEKELGDLQAEAQRLTAEIQGMGSQGSYSGGMIWPVSGSVSCEYGYRMCPFHGYELHSGIDISVSTGTPVHAAASGTVMQAYYNASYGNMVLLDNGGGIYTLYAHNSKLAVSAGQRVKQGDVIAYAGSTGNSTGPHCHFEVRKNGQPVNPRKYVG